MSEGAAGRVLVVGESWIKHTIHMKGFDQFHSTEYEEGGSVFLEALEAADFAVTYVRSHEVSTRFPRTAGELGEYDAIVLSDIGSNSFALTDEVFLRSERSTNRLSEVADYVAAGGGLVMVGGYLSFTGIDGRARYGMSPLAPVLPVGLLDYDDRVEAPQGIVPKVEDPDHEMLGGVSADWPILLGYNRLLPRAGGTVVASVGEDPLLVAGEWEEGRTVCFASDCAPHWAPPEFVEWSDYARLWAGIVGWACKRSAG